MGVALHAHFVSVKFNTHKIVLKSFKTFVSLSRRFLKALVQCWECLPVACSPIYFQTNVSGGYYYTAQNTFPSTFLVLSRFAREITFLAFTSSRLIV